MGSFPSTPPPAKKKQLHHRRREFSVLLELSTQQAPWEPDLLPLSLLGKEDKS